MAWSDDNEAEDQQEEEMNGDAELEMALDAAGMSAGEDKIQTQAHRTAAKRTITGKRPAEETSSSSEVDDRGGAGRPRRLQKKKKKKVKIDSGGGEDDTEPESIDIDSNEQEVDHRNSLNRRQFYFEEDYNSDTSEDEEATALLTLRRNKEAANAARRQQKSGDSAPPQHQSKKNTRGKSKPLVNEPYRELLNQAIDDARTRTVYPDVVNFDPSEITGVHWSVAEKQRFFRALPRVGRHNAVALAAEVVSKSVVEVQGYLYALERALGERLAKQHLPRYSLPMMEDIPAAVEVSEECEAALEEEADRTAEYIAQLERKERGEGLEIIDVDNAREMQARRITGERPDEALIEPWSWISLSQRIFMASKQDQSTDRPTIQKCTLEDMTALITSVTRRLVHMSLFQAHQRLKNTSRGRNHPPEVLFRDTAAAIKMLGMPTTSEEYWRQLPRRMKLNILKGEEGVGRGLAPDYMSYEEVEEALKVFEDAEFNRAPASRRHGSEEDSEQSEEGGWETEDDELQRIVKEVDADGTDAGELSSLEDDPDASSRQTKRDGKSEMAKYLDTPIDIISYLPQRPDKPLHKVQIRDVLDELHFINDDENYLNAVDKLHSTLEERRLWKLLGGWNARREEVVESIVQAENDIPAEPELAAWRRLEKWKRQDWRKKAGKWVPIWRQKYYSRLWEMEKPRRLKRSHKKIPYTKRKNVQQDEGRDDEADDVGALDSSTTKNGPSDSDSEAGDTSDSNSSDSSSSGSSSDEDSDSESSSESE
ncbi:hypothetical protein ABW21_db0207871 [Orbilia brochopaga]|nr:hypothetical protein ABW21_db0207871 [Drechslerella brochopaga]